MTCQVDMWAECFLPEVLREVQPTPLSLLHRAWAAPGLPRLVEAYLVLNPSVLFPVCLQSQALRDVKNDNRVEEMGESVKCLPSKGENLSLIPRTPTKKQGVCWCTLVIPEPEMQRPRDLWDRRSEKQFETAD